MNAIATRWLTVVAALWLALGLAACEENTVEPVRYGALEGNVRDSRNNVILNGAAITTTPATTSIVTDASGHFALTGLPVGKYALSIRKADYRTETVNVNVLEGEPTTMQIMLDKTVANSRPAVPNRIQPAAAATNQATDLLLRWHGSDPDAGDSLRYDVVLYDGNSTVRRQLLTNSRDTLVRATGLKFSTTYFWQVTVRDKAGETNRTDVLSFQTRALPELRYLYVSDANGNTDVFAADGQVNGMTLRLTASAAVETAPQLSPLRDRVAYTSNTTGQYHLYTMSRDGSDVRRITTLPVEGYYNQGIAYRWSPDGAQLIYARYDQLYRINRDGTGLTLLATAPIGRHFREMDWNALTNKIVVQTVGSNVYDSEIYQLNADGSGLALITGNLPGRMDSPSWSIDGRQVLYSRDVAGIDDPMGRQLNARIFLQRPDGSGLLDLSTRKPAGTNDINPRFSPDGSKVIFVNVANDNITPPEIWMMDAADGNNRVRLFQNAALPDWK